MQEASTIDNPMAGKCVIFMGREIKLLVKRNEILFAVFLAHKTVLGTCFVHFSNLKKRRTVFSVWAESSSSDSERVSEMHWAVWRTWAGSQR